MSEFHSDSCDDDALDVLRTLSRLIVDPRDLDSLLRTATAAASERLPDNVVRVWLSRATDGCASCPAPEHCASRWGCLELVSSAGRTAAMDDELSSVPSGRSLVGLVLSQRQEIVSPSIASSGDATVKTWARRHGVDFFLGLPLLADDRLLGVLGFFLESALSAEAMKNLSTVSHLMSRALGSAMALEAQARHALDLEAKVEEKTIELENRVSDLEGTRQAMLNMMSDVMESERRLRVLTVGLEETVADRTRDLIEAKNDAERANRLKSEFLSRVSHELRTPMHGIMSYAKVGIRKIDRSNRDKNLYYFRQILEASDELLPIIDDLLDISRIEAGRTDYRFERQNIAKLVRDLVDKCQALGQDRQIQLEAAIDLDDEPWAVFDRKHLRQVLTNILGNAVKFTGDGTTIRLAAFAEDESIVIQVADRGPGVPEGEEGQIFETFARSSRTGEDTQGAGLGLAIARTIARDHGGDVTVANRRRGGARFTIRLPRSGPDLVLSAPAR